MRLLSADIGNAVVKAVSSTDVASFSSFVAVEQGALRFDGFNAGDDLVIEFEGQRLALGQTAYKLGRLPASEMGRHRVGREIYRQLLAGAMVKTMKRSSDVAAIMSLPVKFYMGERENLREHLSGMYYIGHNGREYAFTLEPDNLHIIPEGHGTLCSLILDTKGNVVHSGFVDERIGVVDGGGRTVDYLVYDGLELIPTMCYGEGKGGVSEIWHLLDEQIERDFGRSLTTPELDKALRNQFFWDGPDKIDISAYVYEACQTLVTEIESQINTLWDGGRAVNRIVMTGGMASLIGHLLPYRHLIVVDEHHYGVDPQFANAIGGYRFGLFNRLDQ